ncbi:MAG: hypothetical protein ACREQ4_09575 [Candidatus Binataceae bacterium]
MKMVVRGPDLRVTPGLAYMNYYFEAALGTQIALTHTASLQ